MKVEVQVANKRPSVTPNSLHRKCSTCLSLEQLLLHEVVLAFCPFLCFSHKSVLSPLTQPWSKPSSETSSCWENRNGCRELYIRVDNVCLTLASLLSLEVRVSDLVAGLSALFMFLFTHQAVTESQSHAPYTVPGIVS